MKIIIKKIALISIVLIGINLSQLLAEDKSNELPNSDQTAEGTPANAKSKNLKSVTKNYNSEDIKNTPEANSETSSAQDKNVAIKTSTIASKKTKRSKTSKNTLNLSELIDKVTHPSKSTDTEESEELPVAKERQVVGWVERVKIYPENIIFDAKLTPGSDGNVMHAEKIEPFKKGDEKWVSFETSDKFENVSKVERKVISKTRFTTTNGKKESRYRVAIPICIAGQYLELEFALANRNIFRQPMRIGGDSLAGHFIIDPARTKTTKPICNITGSESNISE
jgi:hypothetical protein